MSGPPKRRAHVGLVPLTAVAGALLAALIGLAFLLLLWSIIGLGESTAAERHTHTALTQSRSVEGLIVDLETGQRGFVITGQKQFLEPWETARTTFSGQAQQLVRLSITPGQKISLHGRGAPSGPGGRLQLLNPEYELL